MVARLYPEAAAEADRARSMGIDPVDRLLTLDDLVRGNDALFVATGITDGEILKGVRYGADAVTTHSVVMRSLTGTVRFVEAEHRLERKAQFGKRAAADR